MEIILMVLLFERRRGGLSGVCTSGSNMADLLTKNEGGGAATNRF
jgi:hypothetical protein